MRDRRLPLIVLACCAVGIVLGFVLGGVRPRLELETKDAEIAELEARLAEQNGGGWRAPIPGLDRILNVPEPERPLPLARPPESGERSEPRPEIVTVEDGGVARPEGRPWREGWRERGADERLAGFRRAASLQRVRRLQSRAALIQQAGLDPAGQVELDAALQEMNDALLGHGEELVLLAVNDEPPPARDLLGITHDLTGIMHQAQLRIEAIVGESASEVEPSALEIWNHVDLAQLEPAAASAMRSRP